MLEAYRILVAAHSSERIVGYLADLYDAWGKPEKAAEWRAKLPCLSRKHRLESYGREPPTLLRSKAASSTPRAMKRWWEFGFCQDRRG